MWPALPLPLLPPAARLVPARRSARWLGIDGGYSGYSRSKWTLKKPRKFFQMFDVPNQSFENDGHFPPKMAIEKWDLVWPQQNWECPMGFAKSPHGMSHNCANDPWKSMGNSQRKKTNLHFEKGDVLVCGFNPSEKYESQLGWLFPVYGKIKHVPNHQPVFNCYVWFAKALLIILNQFNLFSTVLSEYETIDLKSWRNTRKLGHVTKS